METGFNDELADRIVKSLKFTDRQSAEDAKLQMRNLYTMFMEKDATQVEINPLVETTDHQVFCVDAKINFDDNAAFRHQVGRQGVIGGFNDGSCRGCSHSGISLWRIRGRWRLAGIT
jgi:succinyl-CoA synthetase beta subunit